MPQTESSDPPGEPSAPSRAPRTDAAVSSNDAASASIDEPTDAGPQTEPDAASQIPSEPVACSDQEPPQESPCTTEGEVCSRYLTDPATGYDTYFACQCRAKTSTRMVWDCYEHWGGSLQCPHEKPAEGSSCYGYKDMTCPYPPREQCYCPIPDPKWSCPPPPAPIDPPEDLEPTHLVKDLTDAEQQRWCEWFLELTIPPGSPTPPEAPPDELGYYPNHSCTGCGGGIVINGMMPIGLPISACKANLTLSTCEAPLSELNDCTRSMMSVCWPEPRGCTRYFETPGCNGTIATQGTQCPVRIAAPL